MLYKQPMQQQSKSKGTRPAPMKSWAMPTVSGGQGGGYQPPSWAAQPQPQAQRPKIQSRPDTAYYGQQKVSDAVAQKLGAWGGAKPWEISQRPGHPHSQAWKAYQDRRDSLVDFEDQWGAEAVPDWVDPNRRRGRNPRMPLWARGSQRRGGRRRYAGGGYVKPKRYAGGGPAEGTDTVPAMLTPGEFVVSRPAVRKLGLSNLLEMNAAGGGTNRPTVKQGAVYARQGGVIPTRPGTEPFQGRPETKPFQGANNNFIVDLASDYQDKLDAANAANEARYGQLLAGYDDLSGSVAGQLGDSIGESRDIYGDVVSGWGDIGQGFRSGYGGLHRRTMEGLASQGRDQIAESRKAYDESLASTNAALAARGMAGTTVGGSMRHQADRGYQDAVRGIQESVLRRKAEADMGISQNAMQAIAQAQQGGLGAQQHMASQLANQQAQKANMESQLQRGKFGVIERREDTGPDFSHLMGMVQGAASTGYGQGYGGGYGGGSGGTFNMNDYLGGGVSNPYEAVAAGLLGHTAKPK